MWYSAAVESAALQPRYDVSPEKISKAGVQLKKRVLAQKRSIQPLSAALCFFVAKAVFLRLR
jgi:hypothetical protein